MQRLDKIITLTELFFWNTFADWSNFLSMTLTPSLLVSSLYKSSLDSWIWDFNTSYLQNNTQLSRLKKPTKRLCAQRSLRSAWASTKAKVKGQDQKHSFSTVMILSFRTDMLGQTVQTQIRLLLEEQSDQGLHCLPFRLHRLDSLLYGRAILFKF